MIVWQVFVRFIALSKLGLIIVVRLKGKKYIIGTSASLV